MSLKRFALGDDTTDPKGSGPSAFLVTDLEGASRSTGVVRAAKKVLVDGAKTLARTETYGWALLGIANSGASAGINANPEAVSEALAAFDSAISDLSDAGGLELRPGKGVPAAEDLPYDALAAAGVVAATASTVGDLDGASIGVELGLPITELVAEDLRLRGSLVTTGSITDLESLEADALICGSKVGLIDHEIAARLSCRAIIPGGSVPLTTRAFATSPGATSSLSRTSSPCVGHFCTSCRGHQRSSLDVDALALQIQEFVGEKYAEFATSDKGQFIAACLASEAFLGTWQDELPFGRPLA
ncbi:MAG: hypothetical protein R2735_09565 [Microthrixaceae bacterium]